MTNWNVEKEASKEFKIFKDSWKLVLKLFTFSQSSKCDVKSLKNMHVYVYEGLQKETMTREKVKVCKFSYACIKHYQTWWSSLWLTINYIHFRFIYEIHHFPAISSWCLLFSRLSLTHRIYEFNNDVLCVAMMWA